MGELRFDGRVVIITGAGAGLGRTYALLFGSRGAKVVVNDLGGGRHGEGKSSKAADDVVAEIKRNGGIAVADYNSVVEGEKIIKTALDNFGRVDVLVNNAGILRDKSFPRISNVDWDLIQDVHLKGSFKTTQAAFTLFKKQGYGRIIMTTSNSGLYGNFGQANYSAAKLGLVGLANTIAIEGAKYNIHCNCIAPTAASRLTEDILPPDIFNELKPEFIAPVVAYLCHESCQENGSVIESGAGWAGKCHLIRSNGALLRSNMVDAVTIEKVRDSWSKIINMENGQHFNKPSDATMALVSALESIREGVKNDVNDDDVNVCDYTEKDLILYALGVGASLANESDLRFLYENDENFSPLPTYFVCPALTAMFMSKNSAATAIPGKEVSLEKILHGEQYLEILGDMKPSGRLTTKVEVAEVLDKGSGALIVSNIDSYDEAGNLIVRNQVASFAIGAGNFGGPRTGSKLVACVSKPTGSPDMVLTYKTTVDQAALYRLSGDFNPLHIDPNLAALGGFEKPILHGLCSLGVSVRLILAAYADSDVSLFKAVKVRFTKPVVPGQTLKVHMWRKGNRIIFETLVSETNATVISGAYVDLKSVKLSSVQANKAAAMALLSDAVFEMIQSRVKEQPEKAKSVNAVFLFNITKDGKQVKQWTMDLKNASIHEGTPTSGKPQTTLTISDSDFIELATGKLNPQTAFMKGKLKVAGNIMLAQKLGPLLKSDAKL
ncbi:dehydrogenases short chain [Holotrichia oblita]|uniref:Dehydrogenases short chain n=1 Tax=Holotrichia oblita TaxID=644536 RepID=A0ACB9TNN8_HOLOL|nr:dehydrogenases short chain [Holotrichia oblita]